MNTSQAWVAVALHLLTCTQRELARRLSVSPKQVTKWKIGEHMSSGMQARFEKLLDLKGKQPEFILWAGSLTDAANWERLIAYLAERALEIAETGYVTDPLNEELPSLCVKVVNTLADMGIKRPHSFPQELLSCLDTRNVDSFEVDEENLEEEWSANELLERNPYSAVIQRLFEALNDIWGFYAAYVPETLSEHDDSLLEIEINIESNLLNLAACKIDVDEGFASEIKQMRERVTEEYQEWLGLIKEAAFRCNVPLGAELLNMLGSSHAELGAEAEAQSLGLNAGRLHPDIYMNELLVGMRTLHQVLPAILKKLDIDDFNLDASELSLDLRAPKVNSNIR